MIKILRAKILNLIETKNSWGKNDLRQAIDNIFIEILSDEVNKK